MYVPPPSSEMLARQDDLTGLRLLIAQRRLYSRAKRWLGLRWFGMLVIGLAAPVVSVVWPQLAVVSCSIAGVWLFLARTALVYAQSTDTAKAAAIQEQFDFYVFGMPATVTRRELPSLEELSLIAGADETLMQFASKEKLLNWYPINPNDPGVVAVAISQRANATYTDRLLRKTAEIWLALTIIWVIFLVAFSAAAGISLWTFLSGVLLPVLPASLDVVQHIVGVWRSAKHRSELAQTIERRLKGDGGPIGGKELLAWQARLYELRREAPQVPDLIYKITRASNERAMRWAASYLGRLARRSDE
jgi:hypothetical protein